MESLQDFVNNISGRKDWGVPFRDYFDMVRKCESLEVNYFEEEPDWKDLTVETVAYIVATCHYVARREGIKVQRWFFKDRYFLKKPLFALNAKGMLRVILLKESPKEYRIRNIFVSANVMDRV